MNLYIDAFSGLSGDKINGALLGLLEDKKNKLIMDFKRNLKLDNEFDIILEKKLIHKIITNKFTVKIKNHAHAHYSCRNINDVSNIINNSDFSDKVKKDALAIFKLIAQAESNVHNKPIEEVHFHEVGAIDSIVDILMASYLIEQLQIGKIYSSKIAVGRGFVKTKHGLLPVPAPATTQLLYNIPLNKTDVEAELTTPTGAAIAKHFVTLFTDKMEFNIKQEGCGAGSHDLAIPNYTRIFLIESENIKVKNTNETNNETNNDTIYQLETNIDDCTSEQLAFVTKALFDYGALDVFTIPTIMKKGRLGHLIIVLCEKYNIKLLEEFIFNNTTTLGIRRSKKERTLLARKSEEFILEGITIKVKIAYLNNAVKQISAEYESVKEFALRKKIAYPTALALINKQIEKLYY